MLYMKAFGGKHQERFSYISQPSPYFPYFLFKCQSLSLLFFTIHHLHSSPKHREKNPKYTHISRTCLNLFSDYPLLKTCVCCRMRQPASTLMLRSCHMGCSVNTTCRMFVSTFLWELQVRSGHFCSGCNHTPGNVAVETQAENIRKISCVII